MHSSPPPTHSSDADDAYYEGQPLTSGADRSLQAQRPSTSYGPPHSTSELYPEFYSDLFQPASSDWPLQDDHPSTSSRQQYSSSTPHLRDQYQSPAPAPLAAFHNSSAPVLRERPVKKSSLDNFKGGLKSLFKKNKGPKIGTPYNFKHRGTESTINFLSREMAERDRKAALVQQMSELTVGSIQDDLTIGNVQDGLTVGNIQDDLSVSEGDHEEEDLLPAEREARRLGLELDFSPVHAMNAESSASDRVVRQYSDLGSDFYASRSAKPIYDGKAVADSGASGFAFNVPAPIGQWHCCKCDNVQDLYKHDQGDHLVSVLNCVCPHRSCDNCTLTGDIKLYKPVQEPIPVQLSDDEQKQVLFGVFCGNCGLSWRARVIKNSVIDKISAVPKDLAKFGAAPLDKLRSRSTHNLRGESSSASKSTLNLRALSNEMEKEHGKQANYVLVRFSGIYCSCGNTVDTSSLCCQIVEGKKEAAQQQEVGREEPTFTATPEDRAKGIGKSTLTLQGNGGRRVRVANPLMSNPV